MPKKVSEEQKQEMVKRFLKGISIDLLTEEFKCTRLTIIRHLKQNIGISKYKEIIENRVLNNSESNNSNNNSSINNSSAVNDSFKLDQFEEETEMILSDSSFIEIVPLDYEINNINQKDLSSVHISEIIFPNIVYMIVNKNIELETKFLKDYPDWQFLAQNELKRKTIEIFYELKTAKRFCNKEQKVIKVPNPDVFRIVAPILINRGISRIVSNEKLIAL